MRAVLSLAMAAVLALSACTPEEREVDLGLPQTMSAADQAACKAKGGKIERDGLAQGQVCRMTFADGGKECRKDDDCEGGCFIDGPEDRIGSCAKQSVFFGCNWWLDENGKPAGGMCID